MKGMGSIIAKPRTAAAPCGRTMESAMATAEFKDAIAMLKADHRKAEGLFEQYQSARGSERKRKLALAVCAELKIHTLLEEEIFYPAFKGLIEDDVLEEAQVEHDGCKVLINDLVKGDPSQEYYDAKLTVLSEMVKHHVKEEEKSTSGIFAQCRKADADLVGLRDQMLTRKKELLAEQKAAGLPAAVPKAVGVL
jgi:hypothetical protein